MNKKISTIIIMTLFLQLIISCKNSVKLEKIYDKYNVTGSFLLYDLNKDKFIRINPDRTKKGFLPASTFKIVNSIIAVEENIITDKNHIIKWDGKNRKFPQWNRNHNLLSAFKYSVVWFYQIIARKIGMRQMKEYLSKFKYGNGNLSGGIDLFWLKGNFRVTHKQQIDLLLSLYKEKLPISKRTMKIVKEIMIHEKHPEYIIRAKTGMTMQNKKTLGWWIGYIIKRDNVYFFANCIEKINPGADFPPARIKITKEIFKTLDIL